MAIITVTPSDAQAKIGASAGGDTFNLANGNYTLNLNLFGKSGIVIQAAEPKRVSLTTVNGEPRGTGMAVTINGDIGLGSNTIRGVKMIGQTIGYQKSSLNFGPGALAEDCIITGKSCGVRFENAVNAIIRRCAIQDCGYIGYAGGFAHGILIEDSWIFGNNRGVNYDPAPGKSVNIGGKWYGETMNEAGGGKLAITRNARILRCRYAYNGGVGCWIDWDDENFLVQDCEMDHQTQAQHSYDPLGMATECDKSGQIINCYTHDNQYSGIGLWEALNIKVTGCHIVDRITFRAMGGRGHPAGNGEPPYDGSNPPKPVPYNTTIRDNFFYGNAGIGWDTAWLRDAALRTRWNIISEPNRMQVALPVTWKPTGGTTPPPPPPTGDTMNTPAGAKKDARNVYWFVSNGQAYAGNATTLTLKPETNNIVKWDVINGIFTQQNAAGDVYQDNGSGGWTKLTTGWPTTTQPPPTGTDYHVDEVHGYDIIGGLVKNESHKVMVVKK